MSAACKKTKKTNELKILHNQSVIRGPVRPRNSLYKIKASFLCRQIRRTKTTSPPVFLDAMFSATNVDRIQTIIMILKTLILAQ